MAKLSAAEVDAKVKELPGWAVENGALVREWKFADFVKAMEFVNQVAKAAEAEGHHPDIDIRYNRVRLGLVTHDAGGITEKDMAMATRLGGIKTGGQ